MASEFVATTLGDVCREQGGAVQTGPFGSQLHASDYEDTGTPVVMPANLIDGNVSEYGIARVGGNHVERLQRHRLKSGDIVFSRRGDVTRFALISQREEGWLCGTGCLKVSVGTPAIATPEYLAALLASPDAKEWLVRHAVGATMPNLNTEILGSLPITLPPMREQVAIGSFLRDLRERIDLLRKSNATLEAIAQALFKSWFVDFDPVRAKAEGREPEGMDPATAALFPSEFEESELGLIPKGWRWSTLGQVTARKGGVIQTGPFGSQLHASDYQPAGVPVVMPQDLAGRRVSEDRIARVSESEADRLSRHRLQSGDIVFSRRGDVGRHAIVSGREVGWLCGTGCLLVRPAGDESISTFISAALARPESLEWLVRHAVGATMPNLNTKILSALPLVWPCDEVVRAYEALASPLDNRVSANLVQAQSLALLRDTLLPRLISGKLRLPEAEKLIEEAVA